MCSSNQLSRKMSTPPSDRLRNQNPLVMAIHTAVKGRTRYKVQGLYQQETFKRYLEIRLSKKEGIEQVRANHYTGNVLVFHSDISPNTIALLISEIVLDYRKQTLKSPILPPTSTQKKLDAGNQLVLISGVVCSLAYYTFVLHAYGLDTRILLAIKALHTPLLDRLFLGITFLGEPVTLLLICLGLRSLLLYYNRRKEATTLSIAFFGAAGLNYLLKLLFGRARPALWDWIIHVGHYSFPSGHAMVSMVTYGFIGYTLAQQFPQRRLQIFALTAVLIVAIGFSRLYLGVHWPSDVAAGYAVGLVWLVVCILGLKVWQEYHLSSRYLQQG